MRPKKLGAFFCCIAFLDSYTLKNPQHKKRNNS